MNDTGTLTLMMAGKEESYTLEPPCGYEVQADSGTIRVWDRDSTWVISTDRLVALQLPNQKRR